MFNFAQCVRFNILSEVKSNLPAELQKLLMKFQVVLFNILYV